MKGVTFRVVWTIHGFFPIFGFLFSILWSLAFDYEEAVFVSCKAVQNLPTVSQATGSFSPQRNVWRICVTMQSGIRLYAAIAIYNLYVRSYMGRWRIVYQILVIIAIGSNLSEMVSLITLTSVSSKEDPKIHEKAFKTFIAHSQLYMFLSCCLIAWSQKATTLTVTVQEKIILLIKVMLLLFNFAISAIAYETFSRHVTHCEPYVHSMFAFCEYLLVISNLTFHYLSMFDFKHYSIAFIATEDLVTGPYQNK